MRYILPLSLTLLACVQALPQDSSTWAQCGGQGYTGPTTCPSGYHCGFVNQWYSQCTATAASNPSTTPPSTSSQGSSPPKSSGGAGSAFRWLGRVNPSTRELSWPSSGLAFTFTGKSASIALTSVTGTNSVDIIVDGGAPVVISNVAGTSISTPAGLASGTHTVEIRKRSEAIYGSIVVGAVTTDGTAPTAAVAPTRRIEVIGDSISVGYGLDGNTATCANSAAVEDNPKTYAALAAASLKADYSTIAWSGKGLVRNLGTDNSPLMPELYTRYGANDADNSYTFPATDKPGAVVITLGTNDFSYLGFNADGSTYKARDPIDPSVFTAGLVKFVKSIQTHWTDAQFFLLSSPMLSDYYPTTADAQHTTQVNAIKAAVSQIGTKAHFVDWPTQGSDVACDYHPNAATHAKEATVLASAISSVLGW